MIYDRDTHRHLYQQWTDALKRQVDESFSDASVTHQQMAWGDLRSYTAKHDVPINPDQDYSSDDELDDIFTEHQERLADAMDGEY